MEVALREAVVDDAPAIAHAHVRAWQVAYEGIVPQPFLDALSIDERTELWRQILTGELVVEGVDLPLNVVALIEQKVVGFASVGPWRTDPADLRSGELWAMYVHPDHWGVGAGFALMAATMAHFDRQGYGAAYLWVLDANNQARRFYERQGWSADDVTQDDPVDDIVLVERRFSIDLTS